MSNPRKPGRISAPATMNELRERINEAFADLRNGDIEATRAKELANLVGKAIATTSVQVKYYALRKEKPSIPFLK